MIIVSGQTYSHNLVTGFYVSTRATVINTHSDFEVCITVCIAIHECAVYAGHCQLLLKASPYEPLDRITDNVLSVVPSCIPSRSAVIVTNAQLQGRGRKTLIACAPTSIHAARRCATMQKI